MKGHLLQLAESYAWLNPHLTLRMSWNGEQVINIKASNSGMAEVAADVADKRALVRPE